MDKISMQVSVRKIKDNVDMFEFTIATPILKTQFVLPRDLVNKLRILIEKALVAKKN